MVMLRDVTSRSRRRLVLFLIRVTPNLPTFYEQPTCKILLLIVIDKRYTLKLIAGRQYVHEAVAWPPVISVFTDDQWKTRKIHSHSQKKVQLSTKPKFWVKNVIKIPSVMLLQYL